jgi:hypothetical protein
MATYLLLFIGRPGAPDANDAQTADYNRRWGEYMGGLAQAGRLRAGAPLENAGTAVSADRVDELELADVDIGGFIVVEADSLEAADEIAAGAPHIALGGTTIVRPCRAIG